MNLKKHKKNALLKLCNMIVKLSSSVRRQNLRDYLTITRLFPFLLSGVVRELCSLAEAAPMIFLGERRVLFREGGRLQKYIKNSFICIFATLWQVGQTSRGTSNPLLLPFGYTLALSYMKFYLNIISSQDFFWRKNNPISVISFQENSYLEIDQMHDLNA